MEELVELKWRDYQQQRAMQYAVDERKDEVKERMGQFTSRCSLNLLKLPWNNGILSKIQVPGFSDKL